MRTAGPRRVGDGRERRLAGVTERWVTEVVRQAGGLDQIGVAAERLADSATDLRALQGVGEPGAREVALPRHDDLGLAGEPAQRRGVQHTRPVPVEGRATGALGRLGDPALVGRCDVRQRWGPSRSCG